MTAVTASTGTPNRAAISWRRLTHGLQLVDLHRIHLWLAELHRLSGLRLCRRVPWVDRSRRISLIRGLLGLLWRVLLLRVCRLGLLHAGLLGLAAVHETVDAGRGFDVEFEHFRRLGRVARWPRPTNRSVMVSPGFGIFTPA